MSVNISMNSVPMSRHLRHMGSKAWDLALRGIGWKDLVRAAELEAGGAAGQVSKAIQEWAKRAGIQGYRPLGGWVAVNLVSDVAKVVKDGRRGQRG